MRRKKTIEIIQADVINYLDQADDDVFFMFRPFSLNLFRSVVSKLTDCAEQRSRCITVIYSERINLPESFNYVLSESRATAASYAFEASVKPSRFISVDPPRASNSFTGVKLSLRNGSAEA